MSRGTSVAPERRPLHSVSGSSWEKATASFAPSTSIQSRFLRPGEIWLMTVLPTAPPSVSNCTTAASSVSTARRSPPPLPRAKAAVCSAWTRSGTAVSVRADRKSTRLNSSHQIISYAVFCLKKKKKKKKKTHTTKTKKKKKEKKK